MKGEGQAKTKRQKGETFHSMAEEKNNKIKVPDLKENDEIKQKVIRLGGDPTEFESLLAFYGRQYI